MQRQFWAIGNHCSTARVALALLVAISLVPVRSSYATELPPIETEDQKFLELVRARTFAFFWDTTNRENGLAVDRWPTESPSSIAAVGFALTSYCVGVERGYITRDQAIERVRATLRFLHDAPQGDAPVGMAGYRGFYYHFLDMKTGVRHGKCEISSVDTALLMAGVLACREYFDREQTAELEIRNCADALYRRVEWNWMQPRAPLLCMGWTPEDGFSRHDYRGYNEAMILYLLALGSPTHPINPAAWDAFTATYQWQDFYGQRHINFGPLFGHQYSHIWVDFRGIQDRFMHQQGIDYFENSRRATHAQRAYAIANPGRWREYGADTWGFTACDGPVNRELLIHGEKRRFFTYEARGACAHNIQDDGTIAPTAVAAAITFAPEITLPTLKAIHSRHADHLFGKYGFFDSFNPTFTSTDAPLKHGRVVADLGWFDTDYLGIDQGPILLMIENFSSGFVWDLMRRNRQLSRGLQLAGFAGGWLERSVNP